MIAELDHMATQPLTTDFDRLTPEAWLTRLRGGDRLSLGRALTLIESDRDDHRERAAALIEHIFPLSGMGRRLAVTGTPGVGKSTLIDRLGLQLIGQGRRVAVLAVDPSMAQSGGLMADKTRMKGLARDSAAFIRPSASRGMLNGVAYGSREAMLLCEIAGYDRVILETVGTGQAQTDAADMVDCCILLLAPDSGDEWQAMKKGILDYADLIVVNKADRDASAAAETATMFRGAGHLPKPIAGSAEPAVMTISAQTGDGVEALTSRINSLLDDSAALIEQRRHAQRQRWVWELIEGILRDRVRRDSALKSRLEGFTEAMMAGRMTPHQVARELLD